MKMTSTKKYMRICPGCGKEFDIRGEYIKTSTRYWHPQCHEAKIKEKEERKEDNLGRQAIFNYLTGLGMEPNYIRWGKQRNDFHKKGYTDVGILLTLKYWFEVKQGDLAKANNGMGIVPFIYEDAQKYYQNILEKQEKLEQEMQRCATENKKVIKLTRDENVNKNIGFINFDDI